MGDKEHSLSILSSHETYIIDKSFNEIPFQPYLYDTLSHLGNTSNVMSTEYGDAVCENKWH